MNSQQKVDFTENLCEIKILIFPYCVHFNMKISKLSILIFQLKKDLIEERLDAVAEMISHPEVLSSVQTTLGRFGDVDSLLSLCAILPKTRSIPVVEQRLNQIIGLKTVLNFIPALVAVLSVDIESELLRKIVSVLQDPVFAEMHEKLCEFICEEARVVKGAGAMKLQRCIVIKSGLNGLLDVARQTFCELVEDIDSEVKRMSEVLNLPLKMGFTAQRGYHASVKKSDLYAVKGKNFKIKDLPRECINPQMGKSALVFTTIDLVKTDQQVQVTLVITNSCV